MSNAEIPPPSALTGLIIGQTEKATRAVLDVLLTETATTFDQWVVLRVTATTGPTLARDRLLAQMTDGLKITAADAEKALAGAISLDLVTVAGDAVVLTGAGTQRYERISAGIAAIAARLYGDLPAEDLETTRRILTTVTDRANAVLAGAR